MPPNLDGTMLFPEPLPKVPRLPEVVTWNSQGHGDQATLYPPGPCAEQQPVAEDSL